MKKTIFILTFFILFKPLFPIVEYVVNYEYISKVLCINKEVPVLGCNGKCYLMSELAKSAETEKPISEKKVTYREVELLFFQAIHQVTFTKSPTFTKPNLSNSYSNLYSYLNSYFTFHPPTFIS